MRKNVYEEDESEQDCMCNKVNLNFENNDSYNSETSESEEEDYFEFLKVDLNEAEFENLLSDVNHPLVTIKPIIQIYDKRMGKEIIDLINKEVFFGADDYQNPLDFNKKVDYMISLPNSYLPLMKKPFISSDVICAPLYMNEREVTKFCKPLMLNKKFYSKSKYGMSFKYDIETKKDIQSNYIFHQRLFFDKILKERLTNKSAYGKDAEYELPMTVYEPVSLLRRFCDLFCYISVGFEEIYSKSEYDEEVIIRKLFSSLLAGVHKPLASQGVPLKPLIGETYEVDSENGDMKLFAEVKNDSPVHIAYNIRWKGRKACLDGVCKMKFEFNEGMDEIRIKMGGVNTVRLWYDNIKAYKIFTFNLPLRVCFKGIVDPINEEMERNMSVDSFIYIKGETKSAIIGLNHISHSDIFIAFYGMITKSIVNYDKMLKNGHSFFGVIFHNSGFSLENVKKVGSILQAFAVNTSRRIESIQKLMEEKLKNDKSLKNNKKQEEKLNDIDKKIEQPVNPRFAAISWEDYMKAQEIKEQMEEGKKKAEMDNNKNIGNNISNIVNNESNLDLIQKNNLSNKINGEESDMLKEDNIKDNLEIDNLDDEKKIVKRINVYPFKIYYDLFKKTVVNISKLSTTSSFISSFNMHFIYKLYLGSWAYLNFFEIAYQGNEMNEFYIKYRMGLVNARPISDFNLKKELIIAIDENNFFGKYKQLYGKLWKPLMNPLITDTRYREDLLWLMRFYEIVENYPENERNTNRLDLYEKIRLEAFLNAGKWKEILEAYTYLNISRNINPNSEKEN